MTALRRAALLAAITLTTTASTTGETRDTYFAGDAGPYHVRVVVHVPGVIPGLAAITVAVANPAEIQQVTVQPVFWNVPLEHAPAPDVTRPAEGGEFHGELWLMVSGSYGVRVGVKGDRGEGTVTVPVTAVAFQRLGMPTSIAVVLAGLALFLASGLVTIAWSAARESVLPEGAEVSRRDRRRGMVALIASIAIIGLLFVWGRSWWTNVDRVHQARLYQTPALEATYSDRDPGVLVLAVHDSTWLRARRQRPLIADDGHAAHVFLVSDATFAHLHPAGNGSGEFRVALPALPAGTYRVFTEVVDSSGFTETLTSSVRLPAQRKAGQPDGFWFSSADQRPCVVQSLQNPCALMADESTITLRPDLGFGFALHTRFNDSLVVDWGADEPAEVVLLGSDGDLAHVRQFGTVPWAAVRHFTQQDRVRPLGPPGIVVFPFPLLSSESRRAWVTFRTGGKRHVAMFDLPAASR